MAGHLCRGREVQSYRVRCLQHHSAAVAKQNSDAFPKVLADACDYHLGRIALEEENDYPEFELYQVNVRLDSFFYNVKTKHFRIVGKTVLNNGTAGIPVEICKRNSVVASDLKVIGSSADFTGNDDQGGKFDISFELDRQESILFYLGGAIHGDFLLSQLYDDHEFLDLIKENGRN